MVLLRLSSSVEVLNRVLMYLIPSFKRRSGQLRNSERVNGKLRMMGARTPSFITTLGGRNAYEEGEEAKVEGGGKRSLMLRATGLDPGFVVTFTVSDFDGAWRMPEEDELLEGFLEEGPGDPFLFPFDTLISFEGREVDEREEEEVVAVEEEEVVLEEPSFLLSAGGRLKRPGRLESVFGNNRCSEFENSKSLG